MADIPDPNIYEPASGKGVEPENYPLDGNDISKVSDETLTELFSAAPVLHSYQGTRIVRLSQTLILNGGVNARPCEASILELIARAGEENELQSIPVPRVHRVFNIETEDVFFGCRCLMVMDFINSRPVEECWEDLCQMERVNQQPVGCNNCVARGHWFPDAGAGPFGSKGQLEVWFNRRLAITQHFNQAPKDALPFHFDKLVLTHHDIAPHSGIYPEGFDFAALESRRFAAPKFTDMLFEMIPRHEKVADQLSWIMYALTTAQWIE
ncbi:unnamed protein product [Penicillium nalgiovense]|nr:unnamed protein product [Penicillium nalgiovense]